MRSSPSGCGAGAGGGLSGARGPGAPRAARPASRLGGGGAPPGPPPARRPRAGGPAVRARAQAQAAEQASADGERPLVAASMFGVTTPAVEAARARLTDLGYEVLVFHATGAGGRALEALAQARLLAGVLDLTTTELAD